MKEFAEFEPSFWQEDGMLVELSAPTFGVWGRRAPAMLFAAVALSLANVGFTQDRTLTVPWYATSTADTARIESHPIAPTAAVRGDKDIVSPGFWSAASLALSMLPSLPAEPAEPDDEPLI